MILAGGAECFEEHDATRNMKQHPAVSDRRVSRFLREQDPLKIEEG